jgi:hypothetical protein
LSRQDIVAHDPRSVCRARRSACPRKCFAGRRCGDGQDLPRGVAEFEGLELGLGYEEVVADLQFHRWAIGVDRTPPAVPAGTVPSST